MTEHTHRLPHALRLLAAFAVLASASGDTLAEDFSQMLERQLETWTPKKPATAGGSLTAAFVRARMQDPVVQRAYRLHVFQASQRGAQPLEFATFAYQYATHETGTPAAPKRNPQRTWQR